MIRKAKEIIITKAESIPAQPRLLLVGIITIIVVVLILLKPWQGNYLLAKDDKAILLLKDGFFFDFFLIYKLFRKFVIFKY